MINTLLSMSGAGIRFIFGMGIAQFVDGLAHQAGQTGSALDLVINGFVAGIFVLFWRFARKGEQWAFVVGMALYSIDAAVVVYYKALLAGAFHASALSRLYTAMSGIPALPNLH